MIKRHSRSTDFDPRFDVVEAIRDAAVFDPVGEIETAPMGFRQAIGDYVEHFHSTASLAREHMSTAEAEEFDRAVERVVAPWARNDGMLELAMVATVRWGRPLPG